MPEHTDVRDKLREDCEEFPENRIVVLGSGELADRVNNDPRIRVTHFNVALGLCMLELARGFAERRYGNQEAPRLFDRTREISALERFLAES